MKKIFPLVIILTSLFVAQVRNNPNQLFRLAQTYEQSGDYKKANAIYKTLYEKNPASYSYFIGYTRTLTALKKYDEVIKLCEQKLAGNPSDVNTFGLLGGVYYLKNDEEKAYEIWDNAVRRLGNSAAYRIIANYAIQVRAFEKAIELLNEGKEKSASTELFNYDLANLYSVTMAYGKAAREYCESLISKPGQFYTIRNRINSLLASERAKGEIISVLEECYNDNKNVQTGELLAFAYKTAGEYDKALELIIELDEAENRNGKLVLKFADESLKNNNFEVAKKSYEYLSENFHDAKFFELVKFGLAKSLFELKKHSLKNKENWKPIKPRLKIKASELARPLNILEELTQKAESNKIKIQARMLLAEIYFMYVRDYGKADSLYEEIIVAENRFPETLAAVYFSQGEIRLLRGKRYFGKARELFDKALGFKKANPTIRDKAEYFNARLDFWEGKFGKALEEFSKIALRKTSDYANDAIEKKLIVSVFKKDLINLHRYAEAEYFIYIEKFDSALSRLKKMSENDNLFLLNNIAKLKIAEIFIYENKFPEAVKLLEKLFENNLPEINPDKSMKELGDVYYYGMKNSRKALEVYNKFLEKYPDSFYINIIRENIKNINKPE